MLKPNEERVKDLRVVADVLHCGKGVGGGLFESQEVHKDRDHILATLWREI